MKIRHLLVALFALVSFGAVACGGSEPVPDEQPIETPVEATSAEETPAETAPVEAPVEEAPVDSVDSVDEAAPEAEGTQE